MEKKNKKYLIRWLAEVQVVVEAKSERSIHSQLDKVLKKANKELKLYTIPPEDENLKKGIMIEEDID